MYLIKLLCWSINLTIRCWHQRFIFMTVQGWLSGIWYYQNHDVAWFSHGDDAEIFNDLKTRLLENVLPHRETNHSLRKASAAVYFETYSTKTQVELFYLIWFLQCTNVWSASLQSLALSCHMCSLALNEFRISSVWMNLTVQHLWLYDHDIYDNQKRCFNVTVKVKHKTDKLSGLT